MSMVKKIAVIGLGTVGSQTLLECARKGMNVHGYEQHAPGHDLGAAGGGTRLYRKVLFEDKRYWPLARLADEKWAQLEQDTGELLREPTGCLIFGPKTDVQMQAASSYVNEYELDVDYLNNLDGKKQFPHFRFNDDDEAIFDRHGAIIRPERTIRTAIQEAVRLGAKVSQNDPVSGVTVRSSGVRITTESGHIEQYDTVVLATGPWLAPKDFLPPHWVDVKRPISSWYIMRTSQTSGLDYGFIRTGPEHFYGAGGLDHYEVKVGLSAKNHQKEVDPYNRSARPTESERKPLDTIVKEYIPALDPRAIRSHAYMEAYTTDGHPLVGFAPGERQVILATGFSGKGFKFAPAIGEMVSRMAEGSSGFSMDLLDPVRMKSATS